MLDTPTPKDVRHQQLMGHEKPQQGQELRLDGTRVLLVEDEFYIADDIRKTLLNAGAFVVGPVSTVERATQAVEEGAFDCAIVDLNLHGKSAAPVAERLFALGRSFAIATGYGSGEVPPHLNAVPRIEKPFNPPALLQLLTQLGCANVA